MDNTELFEHIIEELKGYNVDEGAGLDTAIFISSIVRKRGDDLNESVVQACIKGDTGVMVDMLVASAQNSDAFQRALIIAARDLLLNNKRFNVEEVERNETVFLAEPIQRPAE